MSWFFSLIGKAKPEMKRQAAELCPPPIYSFNEDEKYLMLLGGSPETCFIKETDDSKSFLCGIGIVAEKDSYRFFAEADFDWLTENGEFSADKINGHFIAGVLSKEKIIFKNDCLGIREFFYAEIDNCLAVSSRLDLIARFTGQDKLNLKEFSTRWLYDNQISYGSILKNINRILANGRLEITFGKEGNFSFSGIQKPWLPRDSELTSGIDILLDNLIKFPVQNGRILNFALSGGFDSRMLLSILINIDSADWTAFTFGDGNHPDSLIAKKMSIELGFDHKSIFLNDLAGFDDYAGMSQFAVQTQGTFPISEYLLKTNYNQFAKQRYITIDGGFGEILRRGFFNKLYFGGRNSFINKDLPKIHKLLLYPRADVFNNEVISRMENYAFESLSDLIGNMPDVNEYGFENWLDLLTVRTRLTNYCAIEQARADEICISYNPFSQKDFLEAVFATDVKQRLNGKLMREIIRNQNRKLENFPLVKGDVTIPYHLSTFHQKALAKVKKRIGLNYKKVSEIGFLNSSAEWVRACADSISVRNQELYDQNKIKKLINSYYTGRTDLAEEVLWFLSIENFIGGLK